MVNRRASGIQVEEFRPRPLLPEGNVQVDYLGGEADRQTARALEEVSSKFGRLADQFVENEATNAGKVAGNDPAFRPSGAGTLRAQAFDKAATTVYADKLDAKISSVVTQLYTDYSALPADQRNPSALQRQFEAAKTKILDDDAFPEIRGQTEARFATLARPHLKSAADDLQARTLDAERVSAIEAINTSRGAIARLTSGGADTPEAQEALRQEQASIDARTDRLVRRGTITAVTGQKLRDDARTETQQRIVEARLDRIGSLSELDAHEAQYREGLKSGGLKELTADTIDKIDAAYDRRRRQLTIATGADAGRLGKAIDSAIQREREGFTVPAEELAQLRILAERAPGGAALIDRAERRIGVTRSLRGRPPEDIDLALNLVRQRQARTGGSSEAEADTVRYLEELRDETRKAIATDQLGHVQKQGLVQVVPIDPMADDRSFEAQIAARTALGRSIGQGLNRPPQFLQPDDVNRLRTELKKDPDRALGLIRGIVRGAGRDAPAILAELGEGAPELAVAGQLVAAGTPGQRDTARDLLEGYRIKAIPGARLPQPRREDVDKIRSEVVGRAYAELPESRARLDVAATAIWQARVSRFNVEPGSADAQEELRRAYEQAAGQATVQKTRYGGVGTVQGGWLSSGAKVLVPQEVRADRFMDVIGALTEADLAALGPNRPQAPDGTVFGPRALARAFPVRVGTGYRFSSTNPERDPPKFIPRADGQPFTLDLDPLLPTLRGRVPGAFLGN